MHLRLFTFKFLLAYFAFGADAVICDLPNFGVGFSLSLDYATASIYFTNGSAFDIAKINGSPRYNRAMQALEPFDYRTLKRNRKQPESSSSITTQRILQANYFDKRLFPQPVQRVFQSIFSNTFIIKGRLREAIWPWLGDHPDTMATKHMIKALRTAVEAFAETPIRAAGLTVPFPAPKSFNADIRSAFKSAGLQIVPDGFPTAGGEAIIANGLYQYCDVVGVTDPLPTTILTVDYSRAALTAILHIHVCGLVRTIRVLHDMKLGKEALSKCSTQGKDACTAMLGAGLRQITKMPVGDEELPYKDINVSNTIDTLVFVGEAADDLRLNKVLKEVLSEQYDLPSVRSSATVQKNNIDPLFAAARGMAAVSLKYQQDPDPILRSGCTVPEYYRWLHM